MVPLRKYGSSRDEIAVQHREELRKEENLSLYRERVEEPDRELVAGNLDQAQYDSLLVELQQSLLSDIAPEAITGSISQPETEGKRKDKKIEHNWATHIKAPVGENEEDEEFRVVDHSLTPLGLIEEYYVDVNGFLVTMKAKDVKIIREQTHKHPPKKKR